MFKSIYKLVSILVAVVRGLKTVLLVLALSIIVFGTASLHAIGLSSTATAAVPRTLLVLMFLFVFSAIIMILYILLGKCALYYKIRSGLDTRWIFRLCHSSLQSTLLLFFFVVNALFVVDYFQI